MMKKPKKMSAKVQAAVDALLGKTGEPKFTALTSEKIDLLRGLNYYANTCNSDDSKKFAIEWAKKHMPNIVPSLNKQKSWRFGNNGYVLRMVENGFVLSGDQLDKIKAKLVMISKITEPTEEEKKRVPPRRVVDNPNKTFEEFDYAVDEVLQGKTPRSIPFDANKKNLEEVAKQCDKMLTEMEEAPEYFAKSSISPMKKFLNSVKSQIEARLQALVKQRVRKVSTKKVNPVKMASKMPFKRKDEELGLESLRPEALVGAKQAIIYNAQYRFLMYFKAASDEGFSISGSTLKNYDVEKSFFKKIRKPEEMVKSISGMTLATIKKFLNDVRGKEFACKGRFNDSTMILKVSG